MKVKIVIALLLFAFCVAQLAWQRHQQVSINYETNRYRNELKKLNNREQFLRKEIARMCPPRKLYHYWKEHRPDLVFTAYKPDSKRATP